MGREVGDFMVGFQGRAMFCVVQTSRASSVVRTRGQIPMGAFVLISAQLVHCENERTVSHWVNTEARFHRGVDSLGMIPQWTVKRGAGGTIVLIVPENWLEPGFVARAWFVLHPIAICNPFF